MKSSKITTRISKDYRQLCQKFLVADPKKRLGYGPKGFADIKGVPAYSGECLCVCMCVCVCVCVT